MSDDEKKEEHKSNFEETTDHIKDEAKSTAREFKENWNEVTHSGENKKIISGILAIILGSLGIHKYVLGYNKEGTIMLVITLIGVATSCLVVGIFLYSAMGLIGFIEGIIYLTKSDDEFYETYQVNKRPWF
jgi:TM2 domain-containing membrane protein YozV